MSVYGCGAGPARNVAGSAGCVHVCSCNERGGVSVLEASASAVASHPSAVAAVVAVGADLVHVRKALAAAAAA